jgi:hypothetical protein
MKIRQFLLATACILLTLPLASCSPDNPTASDNHTANDPTNPCSYADAERIIALTNMGYVQGGSLDLKIDFGQNAAAGTVNAQAHAAALIRYQGYLATLKEKGEISDEVVLKILEHAKSMDRCTASPSPK